MPASRKYGRTFEKVLSSCALHSGKLIRMFDMSGTLCLSSIICSAIEPGEASFMLGDQDRGEGTVPVARQLHAHRAMLGQHRLAAGAVALVGPKCLDVEKVFHL